MHELIKQVVQWGHDRQIITNGRYETQWLKLMSEFGEMCDSLAKGQSPIDDIGDQMVVIVMMAGISDTVDDLCEVIDTCDEYQDYAVSELAAVYSAMWGADDASEWAYEAAVGILAAIATHHSLTLKQCLEHAYSEIKDRRGYLNSEGVFIKQDLGGGQ